MTNRKSQHIVRVSDYFTTYSVFGGEKCGNN
nr:MAG TPA: hypothetical protein [Caudoviricetes sp.]